MTTNFENEKMNCMISDSSIQKLMNLVRRYDRFTCYIDSYKQEQQAIENNKLIAAQFINTLINMGIDITEAEFLNIVNKTGTTDSTITVEDAVMELLDKELSCYDNSHDITSIKAKAIAFYQNKFSGNRHNDTDYWYRVISLNKDYYVDVNLNTSTGKYEAFFTPNVYGEIDFCVNKELIAIYDFENNVEYTLDNNITKEENKMTTNVKENQTNVKEENKMKTTKTELTKAIEIMESLKASPKTSDDGYIDKKALRKALEPFEFGFNNRTTRKEMVQCLTAFIKERQNINDEIAYGNIIPEQPQQQPQQKTEAQQKTDAFIKKLQEAAVANEKKGYGYTVSSFMLQAIVLNVHNGLEKLQGHTITAEEAEKVEKVHEWCIKKGIISQVLYSINEKSFIRAYTPEYDGKKESKDFWYMTVTDALKAGYTIKECTSYKVHIK